MRNKLIRCFSCAVVFLTCLYASAQSPDLARLEYTYFPQNNSDNSLRRLRAQLKYPIKLDDKGSYLVPGIEYRNVNFKYNDQEIFNTGNLDRFQSFKATLGYTYKMNEFWRFGAEAGLNIASNFSESDIFKDDLIYTAALYFIKTKENEEYYEPWRLILGMQYSTTTGLPLPLPIVNYYKRWNKNWSYMVGTPKSNLKYYINEDHALEAFVMLDGFFSNIQQNFEIDNGEAGNEQLAESMSMTIVISGLQYEYHITENLQFYIYGGHTLLNDIRLRDANRDNIYTINDTNSFYARGGLKFSIF
ncbi:DUF6268 family outer membrane beta-barrel protein [Christiangramia salexigens]|uniref:DUF6268 domain-containing protein n=1 Tax=Christiangramia salexigens TaxID=1913577 RepID=A0A1L3J4V2_9FLAO|nr:DUF6268 family outer membrane beta-barrel protein [Christiangramia salexigens]APG60151.1 hypothetical protein LPB144_06860 [Christiangramia salexigens]